MRIPNGPSGEMTVSASQIRTYGAGGFQLDSHEESRGCPRLYRVKYVDRDLPPEDRSYALEYGSMIHDVFYRMEQDGLTPDEALAAAFPVDADPAMMAEAKADLTAYMERGASPADRYGTLAVEVEMDAVLYVDEEFGEVRWRGLLDHIGIDMDEPTVLHVTDYKSNRFPPTTAQVEGDVQLKSYAWLAAKNAARFGIDPDRVRVIVHLDAIKWREIEVEFTPEEIDDWHDWAVAICRAILRDEEAAPRINSGCDTCPIRHDCPAYQKLPETARQMAESIESIESLQERLAWRDAANSVRLLLEKAVKRIDADLNARAMKDGGLIVGNQEWRLQQEWSDKWDLPALHRALGDRFYGVVTPVKGRIIELTKDWAPDDLAAVNAAIERVPGVVKPKRGRIRSGE